tara:strand:+ start:27 stop:524 length:498 start_codon:yes stop_codon:yes gene_type:complete
MSILDSLPPVIKRELDRSDVKEVDVHSNAKPFILACSRKLEPAELELLKSYGKVLVFHHSYVNIPLGQHNFDYGVFDLHEKVHRDTLAKEDLTKYNVVCVVGCLDKHDDFSNDVHAVNCVHTFPQRQAFKSEFDRLLLAKKIRAPSVLKSVWRFLCFLSDGLAKE